MIFHFGKGPERWPPSRNPPQSNAGGEGRESPKKKERPVEYVHQKGRLRQKRGKQTMEDRQKKSSWVLLPLTVKTSFSLKNLHRKKKKPCTPSPSFKFVKCHNTTIYTEPLQCSGAVKHKGSLNSLYNKIRWTFC